MTAEVQRAQHPGRRRGAGAGRQQHQLVSPTAMAHRSACWPCKARPTRCEAYPLDVLGAQTEGMIGYMIEQELGNLLPFEVPFATILTMVEVDPTTRLREPDQVRRPGLRRGEADRLAAEKGWGSSRTATVAPGRPLAAAQAHLRDPPDQVAARTRDAS